MANELSEAVETLLSHLCKRISEMDTKVLLQDLAILLKLHLQDLKKFGLKAPDSELKVKTKLTLLPRAVRKLLESFNVHQKFTSDLIFTLVTHVITYQVFVAFLEVLAEPELIKRAFSFLTNQEKDRLEKEPEQGMLNSL